MNARLRELIGLGIIILMTLALFVCPASADKKAAKKWIDKEFQPSTLTKDQQM